MAYARWYTPSVWGHRPLGGLVIGSNGVPGWARRRWLVAGWVAAVGVGCGGSDDDLGGAQDPFDRDPPPGQEAPPANQPPEVEITTPASESSVTRGQRVEMQARVSDPDDATASLLVQWMVGGRRVCDAAQPGADGVSRCSYTFVEPVGDLEVQASARDPQDATGEDAVEISVVRDPQAEPSVVIEQPAVDGALFDEGRRIAFRAVVDDTLGRFGDAEVRWSIDGDQAQASPPDNQGVSNWVWPSSEQGPATIRATLVTAENDEVWAEREIYVNGMPEIPDVSITPEVPRRDQALEAILANEGADPDGDDVTYSWSWTRNGSGTTHNGRRVPSGIIRRGDVWEVRVSASDGRLRSEPGTASVTVVNTPPSVGSVSIQPSTPRTSDALLARANGVLDVDGDSVGLAWVWWRDDELVADLTSNTVPAERTRFAQVWRVQVTPSDDEGAGASVEREVTIANTPPSIPSVTVTPSSPTRDQDVTCVAQVSDPDEDQELTVSYRWLLDGDEVSSSATLAAGTAAGGQEVVCVVSVSDGETTVNAQRTVQIQRVPPQLGSATIVPEEPRSTDTLTCEVAGLTADDPDAVTISFRWFLNGVVRSGSTGSELSGVFVGGDEVSCEATPQWAGLNGAPVRSADVQVLNSPPQILQLRVDPSQPYANTSLRCASQVVDPDQDTLTLTYRWLVDGDEVPDAGSETLAPGPFAAGQEVTCRLEVDDGLAVTVEEASRIILNRPPSIAAAVVTPEAPRVDDLLRCEAVGVEDIDGDEVEVRYAFFRRVGSINDIKVGPGPDQEARTGDLGGWGARVGCEVEVFDRPEGGELRSGGKAVSPIVTVQNTPPVALGVPTVTPDSPRVGTPLQCTPPPAEDADGDGVAWRYQWYVGGEPIPGAATLSLSGGFQRGESVQCEARPWDGRDEGEPVMSEPVVVVNTPPTGRAALSPQTIRVTTTLTCDVQADPDPDGDEVTVDGYWVEVDGTVVATSSANVFPPDGALWQRDQSVRCGATLSDGLDTTDVASSAVQVRNSSPLSADIFVEAEGDGGRLDSFLCGLVDVQDPDPGDEPTVRFRWQLNEVDIAGATEARLDLSDLAERTPPLLAERRDRIRCFATPTDGLNDGLTRNREVLVGNTLPTVSDVRVEPEAPFMDEVIHCVYDFFDADDDEDNSTIRWFRNGEEVDTTITSPTRYRSTSPPGAAWNSHNPEAGDVITCEVQARDAMGVGETVAGSGATVQASRPSIDEVVVTADPSPAVAGSSFTCAHDFSDPRGLDDESTRRWWLITREGNETQVQGEDTYSGPPVRRGDRVECRMVPFNGTFEGLPIVGSSGAVNNTPPPTPTISFGPPNPRAGFNDVTCGITGQAPDVDDDPITWRIRIFREGSDVPLAATTEVGGASALTLTASADVIEVGDRLSCVAEAYDGEPGVGGNAYSEPRISPTIEVTCDAGSGQHPSCPATSCKQAFDDGHLLANGPLWVQLAGAIGSTWCEFGLAGGFWNLAVVVADDGADTWTWERRDRWENASPFGPDDRLDRDRKTVIFGNMGVRDLLVVHQPSGVWALYEGVGAGTTSLASLLQSASASCPGEEDGFEMTAGTLEAGGDLCSTRLFFHPRDHGGVGTCGEGLSDAWGPAWSTGSDSSCPFDAPGATGSMGPDRADPTRESLAFGFGDALDLNSGEPETGENRVLVYIRQSAVD